MTKREIDPKEQTHVLTIMDTKINALSGFNNRLLNAIDSMIDKDDDADWQAEFVNLAGAISVDLYNNKKLRRNYLKALVEKDGFNELD